MGIFTANLKQLYQRRIHWLVYLIFGGVAYAYIMTALKSSGIDIFDVLYSRGIVIPPLLCPLLLLSIPTEASFIGLVLLPLPIGYFVARVPMKVSSKPFSYCLPGYHKIPGRFVCSIGIVTNILGSLLFLAHPELDGWQQVFVICSAFGVGSIMYWLGVWYVWNSWIFLASMVLLAIVNEFIPYVGFLALAERTIIEVPFEMTMLGILYSLVGWWQLTSKNNARRLCAEAKPDYPNSEDISRVHRDRRSKTGSRKKKLTGHPHPWVDELFLGRMNTCDYLGMGRHIWGGLYTTFAVALSMWKLFLFLLLLMYTFYLLISYGPSSSYDDYTNDTFWLFFLPAYIFANLRLPFQSTVLTPQGRKERLVTAAIVSVSITLLAAATIMIVTALSFLLATIIPEIEVWEGIPCEFHALDMTRSCLLILAMPAALTIKLLLFKKPALMRLSVYILFALAISIPDPWFIPNTPFLWSMIVEPTIKPLSFAIFMISNCCIFVGVLWCVCMKRPLAGQTCV